MFTIEDALEYFDIGKNTKRVPQPNGDDHFLLEDDKEINNTSKPGTSPNIPIYYKVAFSNLWIMGIQNAHDWSILIDPNYVRAKMIEYLPVMNYFSENIIKSIEEGKPFKGFELPKEYQGDKIAKGLKQSFADKNYGVEAFAQVVVGCNNKVITQKNENGDYSLTIQDNPENFKPIMKVKFTGSGENDKQDHPEDFKPIMKIEFIKSGENDKKEEINEKSNFLSKLRRSADVKKDIEMGKK